MEIEAESGMPADVDCVPCVACVSVCVYVCAACGAAAINEHFACSSIGCALAQEDASQLQIEHR